MTCLSTKKHYQSSPTSPKWVCIGWAIYQASHKQLPWFRIAQFFFGLDHLILEAKSDEIHDQNVKSPKRLFYTLEGAMFKGGIWFEKLVSIDK